jgi:hypothetical protein
MTESTVIMAVTYLGGTSSQHFDCIQIDVLFFLLFLATVKWHEHGIRR